MNTRSDTIREMLGKALEQYGAELPGLEACPWIRNQDREDSRKERVCGRGF